MNQGPGDKIKRSNTHVIGIQRERKEIIKITAEINQL